MGVTDWMAPVPFPTHVSGHGRYHYVPAHLFQLRFAGTPATGVMGFLLVSVYLEKKVPQRGSELTLPVDSNGAHFLIVRDESEWVFPLEIDDVLRDVE